MFKLLLKDVYSYIKREIFSVRNLFHDADSRIDKLSKRISHLEAREISYWKNMFRLDKEGAERELMGEYEYASLYDIPFPILGVIEEVYGPLTGYMCLPLGKLIKDKKERGKDNE